LSAGHGAALCARSQSGGLHPQGHARGRLQLHRSAQRDRARRADRHGRDRAGLQLRVGRGARFRHRGAAGPWQAGRDRGRFARDRPAAAAASPRAAGRLCAMGRARHGAAHAAGPRGADRAGCGRAGTGMSHTASAVRILFFADAASVHTRRWEAAAVERAAQAIGATRRPAEVPVAQGVIALAPGGDKPGWFTALPAVRRVSRELAARFQPTLVHGHYVTSYGLWAAACGLSCPKVLTAWGSDILVTPRESRLMRAVVGWSLRHADLITADSMDMVEEIARYHPQAPCHQIL